MSAAKPRIQKSAAAYRSIGEVAKELGLETHVLRYWETKFPKQVKPIKRNDGRRMFRAEDAAGLRAIQILVHERGLTLKGAKALLNEQGVEAVLSGDVRLASEETCAAVESPARELQDTVKQAFETPTTSEAGGELDPLTSTIDQTNQSVARLRSVLKEMERVQQRLDARQQSAA
ncbi:MAG: MerR family transcriptional regulator [Pseudomonadota bacterium]